jgi:hypothetical protein
MIRVGDEIKVSTYIRDPCRRILQFIYACPVLVNLKIRDCGYEYIYQFIFCLFAEWISLHMITVSISHNLTTFSICLCLFISKSTLRVQSQNMPWLEDIFYDRDETITAVRVYYRFLTDMYMDESLIKEPPEGGWPNINQEILGPLGKTDEVINLLAHLPYINDAEDGEAPDGTAYTQFLDWPTTATDFATGREEPEDWVEGIQGLTEPNPWPGEAMPVPASVVGLLSCRRDDNAYLLDTELGIVQGY